MKTPKSTKKAEAVAVESATPVKMKTPKKLKTPKAEIPAAETPQKKAATESPKTPKIPKTPQTKTKIPNTPQIKTENEPKVKNGGSETPVAGRKNRVRNPKAVYMFFEKDVDTNVAKALMKKFGKSGNLSFGRGFVVHFDDEAKATELIKAAENMEFAGVKPEWAKPALLVPVKRSAPANEPTPKKKSKVAKKTEEDDNEEEEEEVDDE